MAWVNSVSGVLHPFVFFGVFPCVWVFPTPSYHMLCNYHTSFRVTPTTHSLTHSLTPPRLASPTRKPRLTVTRGDQVSGHHLNPQPRTLNKPTPAPHKSSTSRQPRRPRRRPATPPTPVNTHKSPTNKQPGDLNDGQHTRPHPRTRSNTQMSRAIDTNHDQQHEPNLDQQAHQHP